MEKRFGVDFSNVRAHTDSNAVQMSRELNAEAFTYGRDIYFGAGRYSPCTLSGRRLLAHELTHVVQQQSSTHLTPWAKSDKVDETRRKDQVLAKMENIQVRERSPLHLQGNIPEHILWRGIPPFLRATDPHDSSVIDSIILPAIREAIKIRHDFQTMLSLRPSLTTTRMLRRPAPTWESNFVRGRLGLTVRGMVRPSLPTLPSLADLATEHQVLFNRFGYHIVSMVNLDLATFLYLGRGRLFPDIGYSPGPPERALHRLSHGTTVLDRISPIGMGAPDLVRLLLEPMRSPDQYYW